MKFRIAFLGLAIALVLAMETTAKAAEIDSVLQSCVLANDQKLCEVTQESLREDWKNAPKGNYQAQRNIAFCLQDGCNGAFSINPVLSCAWRMVIMASPAEIDQTDAANYLNDCGRLNGSMRNTANLLAKSLFKKIYKRKMDFDF